MAQIIDLKTFTDKRGNLTVIEKVIPFDIKRVFYIYGVDDSKRGGHRHHKTRQAAICIKGACTIYNNNGEKEDKDGVFFNTVDQKIFKGSFGKSRPAKIAKKAAPKKEPK